MTLQKRVRIPMLSFVLLGVLLGETVARAQETLSSTQDPAQHQEWGLWRVMNSQYPRILVRVRCDYDVKVDGKWSSWWGYQLRNTYQQQATDYVYTVEYGDPSGVNRQEAPSMVTGVGYENIQSGGTGLWGTCGQHPLPNGLHIKLQCAAPEGQDAPCFKDANGKAVTQAKASDTDAMLHGAGPFAEGNAPVRRHGTSAPTSAKQDQFRSLPQLQTQPSAYYCYADFNDPGTNDRHLIYTRVWVSSKERAFFDQQFTDWVHKTYSVTLANNGGCPDFSSADQARTAVHNSIDYFRTAYKFQIEEVTWLPQQ